MRIGISTLLEFKKFKNWFRGVSEFNIVVDEKTFSLVCHKGGVTHIATLAADIDSDIELPLGFSFYSSLLLNLPYKSKGLDEFRISISDNSVTVDLNGRAINVMFTLYDQNAFAKLNKNPTQQRILDMKELTWLLNVSKHYRSDNIQVCNKLAYLDTEDGIYYVKLSKPFDIKFSFVPALLNAAKSDAEVLLSSIIEIKSPPFRTFSMLYKIDETVAETIAYARNQKLLATATLSLSTQRSVIKSLRVAEFVSTLSDKRLIVTTKDNERLYLMYDSVEVDINAKDLETYGKISDAVFGIRISGYSVHQLIANEKTVGLYVTPYANFLKFGDNGFLLLRRME